MKQLLIIIISVAYFVTTTGATMHMHFCKGKLSDSSLWFKGQEKICGKCGMEKKEEPNGCCSDEYKWVKIQDEQKASVASYDFSKSPVAEPIHYFTFENQLFLPLSADLLPQSHAPPRNCEAAIYKRNCLFLI
jgi:hypothetical protein